MRSVFGLRSACATIRAMRDLGYEHTAAFKIDPARKQALRELAHARQMNFSELMPWLRPWPGPNLAARPCNYRELCPARRPCERAPSR
ncbi:MAG: hypothetical protein QOG70_2963 [Solirubrobacteraceae bacterium]|jgi:hypothetical protein|nr:hypothetical protein [Solirubrobacteraceae bacterium]